MHACMLVMGHAPDYFSEAFWSLLTHLGQILQLNWEGNSLIPVDLFTEELGRGDERSTEFHCAVIEGYPDDKTCVVTPIWLTVLEVLNHFDSETA